MPLALGNSFSPRTSYLWVAISLHQAKFRKKNANTQHADSPKNFRYLSTLSAATEMDGAAAAAAGHFLKTAAGVYLGNWATARPERETFSVFTDACCELELKRKTRRKNNFATLSHVHVAKPQSVAYYLCIFSLRSM